MKENNKTKSVRVNANLVKKAEYVGKKQHRSINKQIEHWIEIGKSCEENPDLPFNVLSDILIGLTEKIEANTLCNYENIKRS